MFGKKNQDQKISEIVSKEISKAREQWENDAAAKDARLMFQPTAQFSQDSLQTIKEFITSNKSNYVKSRIAHPGHETVLQVMHLWGVAPTEKVMFAPSEEAQSDSYHDRRTINLISKDGLSRQEVVSSIAFAGMGPEELTAKQKERLTEGNRK